METKPKVPAPKGNKTTEIILGAAASKLNIAVKAFNSTFEIVGKLEEKASNAVLEVTNLEDKIGGLKQDYMNKVAQNKIEIEQAFNTDQRLFVDKWLMSNGWTLIKEDDLDSLKSNLEEATNKKDDAIRIAVGAATSSMKKDHDNATSILKLEHEKKEANNTAEIGQLKMQNKFLEDQVTHWKNMLSSQVSAETERAKYGQINNLNVGTGNPR